MSSKTVCSFCLLLGIWMASSSYGWGYVRSKVPDSEHIALFWGRFPVPYHVHILGTPNISDKVGTYNAIHSSFDTWTDVSCTCLTAQHGGLTNDSVIGYDQQHPEKNVNLIIFQTESWVYASSAVAVTTNIFNLKTGEVVAFDLEMNNVRFRFSLDGGSRQGRTIDVQNTITHEVGHVFGLDHTPVSKATMYASAPTGELSKRSLHQDDIEGICTIYPKDRGCKPHGPDPSNLELEKGCGCSSSPLSRNSVWLLLLLISLAFIGLRRLNTGPKQENL